MSRTTKPRVHGARYLHYGVLVFAAVQALFPVVWMVLTSFKTTNEFYTSPWGMPRSLVVQNYADAWSQAQVGDYLGNTVLIVIMGLAILLTTSTLAAYALARLKFPGKKAVLAIVLAVLIVPPDVISIPLFIVVKELGLLGTQVGLAFIYAAGGFGVATILLRTYFLQLPRELEEAAMMDGAGRLSTLRHVMLPLVAPGFLTVAVLQTMRMWNDLYLAFVFLPRPETSTVSVGLMNLFRQDTIVWPVFFAGLVLITAPILLMYIVSQRTFVQGVAGSGMKS